jgi:N-acyl homoserine lactone hydrolase
VVVLPGLELIETGGHVRGHQSVLVRLPESGAVLLAIDAVPEAQLFTPERQARPLDEDESALRISTQRLLDLVAKEKISLVIFGHDGQQWQTLKKTPLYYR